MAERKRNYDKEYKDYQGKPSQIKRRAQRNAARREMIEKGKVKKGSSLEVDHIRRGTANSNLSNSPSNLRVITRKANRSRNSHLKK